jgi:putative phosphoribosyl transferase
MAPALQRLAGPDTIALGLTRGGVAVAAALARRLGVPLDAIIVKKIGAPGNPEYAIGAIAETGEPVINSAEARALGVDEAHLTATVAEKRREMNRQRDLYRGGRPLANLKERTVLLVDDGIATGLTMRAAIAATRAAGARHVVVAVPVGSPAALDRLKTEGTEVVCPEQPTDFWAVGAYYEDFLPVGDEEVTRLLREAADQDEDRSRARAA